MAESNQRKRFSNVLIVEDDDAQRATLSDIMEQEGFQPYTASNGLEALDLARQRNFGVAILDFRLPDISGTELLERIHSINQNVRVVIHTGNGSFDSAKDAVNQGAFAYVEKAGDPDELLRHVHRAVQSQYDTYAGELEAHVAERTASLGESEERYRSLVEFSLDGIALHTRAGLIYVNLPGARFLGAAHPNELIGRRLRDFVRSDQQDAIDERIARIMNEKTPAEIGEVNILTGRDNEKILEVRGIYTAIAGEPVVQLLLRDVTQARKDEENRRLFETRMRETQKMEVAGQLAAGIAHDFNNLLTVILGSSELLRERIAADRETTEVHKNLIEQIDGAGQRAAALTSRLLTFSRRQPVRLVHVNINEVIREMKHLLSGVLGDSVQLNLKLSTNLPLVLADISQLEQVIMNLTVNARDAMPNGGTFTLKTGLFQPDERFASQHSCVLARGQGAHRPSR
ncbi:MAG: response regulator [Planctomycetes bacterium]|nr:response regulator [Planctomycetota bacterium]